MSRMFIVEDIVKSVGFSPIGLQITAIDSSEHSVSIWDQSNNNARSILEHNNPVYNFAWSYCEQWIATACDNSIWLWSTSSNQLAKWTCAMIIRDFQGKILSIDWRRNSLEFVTGCEDGSVRVWRLVETLGEWSVQLVWGAGNKVFAASGALFLEAIDLCSINKQLLEQRK
ncbi:hypothetical protein FBU30_007595 [Linnemannia zychae]|nr:hypothetical protein FBU30_007595 [Linnemannia zychae]